MTRLSNAQAYSRASTPTLLEKAKEVVEKELTRSTTFDADAENLIPKFDMNELSLGRVVGRGGFCAVREINAIRLAPVDGAKENGSKGSRLRQRSWNRLPSREDNSTHSNNNGDLSSRELLARRVWSKKGGKYVVKIVEPSLLQSDRVTFLKGTIDLALETKYLASLNHRHILNLRGMSSSGPFDDVGYFLILDQLQETLPKRLNTWMHTKRASKGITGMVTGGKRKTDSLLTDRLLVAYDVAEVLDYLHGRRIIYRDLKPDNIGFDEDGMLKIFDFGLAKELLEEDRDENGLYRHMTGFTGSVRYMAPEVGLKRSYNLKADVYSWSMLMWYIMALEPPFGMYTPNMFIDRVFKKGYRPMTKHKWPEGLCILMKKCWSDQINERPTFKDIMLELKKEANSVDPQVASFMGHSSGEFAARRK